MPCCDEVSRGDLVASPREDRNAVSGCGEFSREDLVASPREDRNAVRC
jgi:hypothetical protein